MNAGVWQDQQVRRASERAGWKLCGHCNGTGNELYAMYRACPKCGGSGHVGEPPMKVRLSRWVTERKYRIKAIVLPQSPSEVPVWIRCGLGIGADADGVAAWHWASKLRWAVSRYLCIGQWFRDGRDDCHRCGTQPSDVDFLMRRVGFRRAECIDPGECREHAELERADPKGDPDAR